MGMVYVDGQLVFQQEPSGPESEECGVGSPEQAVTVSIDLPWHTASTVTLRFDSNLNSGKPASASPERRPCLALRSAQLSPTFPRTLDNDDESFAFTDVLLAPMEKKWPPMDTFETVSRSLPCSLTSHDFFSVFLGRTHEHEHKRISFLLHAHFASSIPGPLPTQGIDGWTSNLPNNGLSTSTCGEYGSILGGTQLDRGKFVEKTFTDLPAHTGVQLSFDAIFIDSWVRIQAQVASRSVRAGR